MINDEMIQYLKTMQEKNVIERREHLAKIIYQYAGILEIDSPRSF